MIFLLIVALVLLVKWTSFNIEEKPREVIERDPRSGKRRRVTYYSTDSDEFHDNRKN